MVARRRTGETLGAIGVALLLAVTAASCGGSDSSGSSGSPGSSDGPGTTAGGSDSERTPELAHLMVGIIPIANLTPLYVAQELGFFEDRGLTVETTSGTGGAALTAALQGGSLNLAYTAYSTIIQAAPAGLDLRIVAHQNSAQEEEPDSASVIVKDDGPIQSVADLADKRIAVNALNNINYVTLRAWLDDNGVDSESVEFIEVPFPNMGDALARGDIDAANQVEPFNTILGGQGAVRTIGYPFVETHAGLDLAGFVADGGFVDDNPVTVQLFAEALDEANRYLADNPEEVVELVAEFTESDAGLVEQMILDRWFTHFEDLASLEYIAELSERYGLVDEVVDVTSMVHCTAIGDGSCG